MNRRHQLGFTLIELIVVLSIVVIAATFGIPGLIKMIHRGKMEAFHRATASVIQLARIEAIKRERPTVVQLDFATNQVEIFLDMDDNGEFNPDTLLDPRATDFRIAGPLPLPPEVFIWAPMDGAPKGTNAVDGFTPHPDTGLANQLVFEGTGSLRDIGAYRFGDASGNFLEIRVSPRASARVELRKWDATTTSWLAKGENGTTWRWY